MTHDTLLLSILSWLSSSAVGLVFVVTGVVKALAPLVFTRHLAPLRLLRAAWLRPVAALAAVGECLLGVALLLRAAPHWLLPGTMLLLVSLAGLTSWSIFTRRTEDCGCYGGLVEISPLQSILLNGLYVVGLGWAWWYPVSTGLTPAQHGWLLLGAGGLIGVMTGMSHWSMRKFGANLLDMSPLQPGRPWKTAWLEGATPGLMTGSHLVAFVSATCPHCQQWLRPLKVMHNRPDLPSVIGAMTGTPEEIAAFVTTHALPFPVLHVEKRLANWVDAVPMLVVLENGVMQTKPGPYLPPHLVEQIKQPAPPKAQERASGMLLHALRQRQQAEEAPA